MRLEDPSKRWLTEGWGYEITALDVHGAYDYALKAAKMLGVEEQVRKDIHEIVNLDGSTGTFVKEVLRRHLQ